MQKAAYSAFPWGGRTREQVHATQQLSIVITGGDMEKQVTFIIINKYCLVELHQAIWRMKGGQDPNKLLHSVQRCNTDRTEF